MYLCSHIGFSLLSVKCVKVQHLAYRCDEEHKKNNEALYLVVGFAQSSLSSWLDQSPPGKISTYS